MGKKKNQKSAGGNQPPQATTDKGGNMDNPGCKGLEGVRSSGEEDSENAIPTVHRSHPEGLRNENSMAHGGGIGCLHNTPGNRELEGGRPGLIHERTVAHHHIQRTQAPDEGEQPAEPRADDNSEEIPYPLFPPGPDETDKWRELLRYFPGLEPTYCKESLTPVQSEMPETESQLRGAITGPVTRMDRPDIRLRQLGNGVVPSTCAVAFRVLSAQLIKEGVDFPELPWKKTWDE